MVGPATLSNGSAAWDFRVRVSSFSSTMAEVQKGCETVNTTTTAVLKPAVSFSSFKPQLVVEAPIATEAVQFYKDAFGAQEIGRTTRSKRKADKDLPLLLSAEMKLGSAVFSVSELDFGSPAQDRNDKLKMNEGKHGEFTPTLGEEIPQLPLHISCAVTTADSQGKSANFPKLGTLQNERQNNEQAGTASRQPRPIR